MEITFAYFALFKITVVVLLLFTAYKAYRKGNEKVGLFIIVFLLIVGYFYSYSL